MGLFTFIKSAGEKIFGSPAHAANSLTEHVKQIGGEHNLQVEYSEGKVTVSGEIPTQEMKEKTLLALGNVEGVETVEDKITVQNPDKESRFYTVKKGDTLSRIAEMHYHKASEYKKIFEANKPLLSHPDRIYPGQVLRIPD